MTPTGKFVIRGRCAVFRGTQMVYVGWVKSLGPRILHARVCWYQLYWIHEILYVSSINSCSWDNLAPTPQHTRSEWGGPVTGYIQKREGAIGIARRGGQRHGTKKSKESSVCDEEVLSNWVEWRRDKYPMRRPTDSWFSRPMFIEKTRDT